MEAERQAVQAQKVEIQVLLETERAALQTERQKAQSQLEEERQRLEKHYQEKEKASAERAAQQDAELANKWRIKENDLVKRIAVEQQKRLEELEKASERQLEAHLATQTESLREQNERERALQEQETARQRAQIEQAQKLLADEQQRQRAQLAALVQKEKNALNTERGQQEQLLARERERLEQEWLAKETELAKQYEEKGMALQAAWANKQQSWLADHEAAVQKAEQTLSAKLHEAEAAKEARKAALETDLEQQKAEL